MSQILIALSPIVAAYIVYATIFRARTPMGKNIPPIIPIPEDDIYNNPREAYDKALTASGGHVIGVRKKGRLEFIVDDTLVQEVLTNNDAFSFEDGVMTLLNMKAINDSFTDFFVKHDDLVRSAIINRLPYVINKVLPFFVNNTERLVRESNKGGVSKPIATDDFVHRTLCEAMTEIILGPDFVNSRNIRIIEEMVHGMARVSGIYQNTSWWGRNFPAPWKMLLWIRELSTSLLMFNIVIGRQIWRALNNRERGTVFSESQGSVLDYLIQKYCRPSDGKSDLKTFFKILGLISGNFFAAVHLTTTVSTWVLFELAKRPEYLPALREELLSAFDISTLSEKPHTVSYDAMQQSVYLDSFIREVLRTKGDILSVCRMTRRDVTLAGYDLPKGYLVLALTTLSHFNPKYHGPDASEFKGERWIGTNKRATSVGKTYLPFGLGRWSCPGRNLAIAEIKLFIWSIICRATPVLEGNSYDIVDKLEITARAPRGKLMLVPYSG